MGTYDRVEVAGTVFQTKSLGKTLHLRAVGSTATVRASAFTQEEFALGPTHPYKEVPERYTVEVISERPDSNEKGFLLIEAGIIIGLVDSASARLLPSFDYYGRSNDGLTPIITEDPVWTSLRNRRPRR